MIDIFHLRIYVQKPFFLTASMFFFRMILIKLLDSIPKKMQLRLMLIIVSIIVLMMYN